MFDSSPDVTFKRSIVFGFLVSIAFVGSCVALIPPAVRLAGPVTHRALDTQDRTHFPILIVRGDKARVLMLEDVQRIPPLPLGSTYLVPPGKEASLERDLNLQTPPGRDASWVLKVERSAADQQRIELFLIGDGYWGGGYDATQSTVTPRYRKITGPGFAFVVGGYALAMNLGLWGIGVAAFAVVRRWRAAGQRSAADGLQRAHKVPRSDASRTKWGAD